MSHSAAEQQASDAFARVSVTPGPGADRAAAGAATSPAPEAAASWRRIAGHPLVLVLALALVNFGAGRLGMLLATPPGYATAIFPPAGVALGALLALGPRLWPGVFLGSVLLNLSIAPAPAAAPAFAIALSIAGGSTAQALLGVWLLRRFSRVTPTGIDTPGTILSVMLLGGPVACLLASSWGVATLVAADVVPRSAALWNWLTWWIGDSMGVLVFTPFLLLAAAPPGTRPRRRMVLVGVPLSLTFAIAVLVFFYVAEAEQRRAVAHLERQSLNLTASLEATLTAYVGAVEAVKNYYDASEFVSRDEFRRFTLPLLDKYRGIRALAWVPRVSLAERAVYEARARADATSYGEPGLDGFSLRDVAEGGGLESAGKRAEYYPVYYLEPAARHRAALGLEVPHDAVRARALRAAAASGATVITAPIDLISGERGILALAPVYLAGADVTTADARRAALTGFALGVLRADDVAAAARVATLAEGIPVSIEDVDAPPHRRLIYGARPRPGPLPDVTREIDVGGRSWRVHFTPTAGYVASQQSPSAFLVLFGGVLFTALVGAFLLIITGRLASIETQVRERTAALRQTNEELEKFAYAASHDLKAPLRGVRQLATWLQAERDNVLTARSRRHLELLRGRVTRMDALLDGLLHYSRAGRVLNESESVDVGELLAEAIELASVPTGFEVLLPGELPVINSYRMPLLQVFLNLIANAVKHHDRDHGRIEIRCRERGEWLEFHVIDDGPGIPVVFRERVFGLFQTLQSRDQLESSGMGLAIVKKIIESHRGGVHVEARESRGTHVCFTWPRHPRASAAASRVEDARAET